MRVIAKKILRDFWGKHRDCEQQLKAWYQEATKAEWTNPNEIKVDYPSASIIGNDRAVFNIKGNSYRLIVRINFDYQMVWIRFIGTHSSYNKIDAKIFNMNIKPIKTKKDYEEALRRLDKLFDAKKGTPKGDELEILGILIEKYENENFPIDLPDPVEAIKFRMEQNGLNQTDLANVVGQKSRASEILNRKRKLSLEMIRQIHKEWHIPTEVLVQAY